MLRFCLIGLLALCLGCLRVEQPGTEIAENPTEMAELVVDPTFSYQTTEPRSLTLEVLDPTNEPLAGAYLRIYDLARGGDGTLIFTGQTDAQGRWQREVNLPPHQDSLLVLVYSVQHSHAYRLFYGSGNSTYRLGGDPAQADPEVQVHAGPIDARASALALRWGRPFGESGEAEKGGKVVICHIPPGNPNNPQTIEVAARAVPAHLAHGDVLGPCGGSIDSTDTDGDDVLDGFDAYPEDSTQSFDEFIPGENDFGTVAYEDLWPYQGDYDFNDLVVDYNYQFILNSAGMAVKLKARFTVKAVGAGMSNGFGFVLSTPASDVASVTGQRLLDGRVTLAPNGVEAGQSQAVVIAFDHSHKVLGQPEGRFINTEVDGLQATPDTIEMEVVFANPMDPDALGDAPFNPFIFTQRGRGHEVHLADQPPTDLASVALFGTGNDDSQPSQGRFYKTASNLPWAVQVPTPFDYPRERTPIIEAHLKFGEWAQSRGNKSSDWYARKAGYRAANKIYD